MSRSVRYIRRKISYFGTTPQVIIALKWHKNREHHWSDKDSFSKNPMPNYRDLAELLLPSNIDLTVNPHLSTYISRGFQRKHLQIHVSGFIQPSCAPTGGLKRQGTAEEDVSLFQDLQIWLPVAEGSAALETLHRCAEGARSSLQHLLPSETMQREQTLQGWTEVSVSPPRKIDALLQRTECRGN